MASQHGAAGNLRNLLAFHCDPNRSKGSELQKKILEIISKSS